ncbi:hypothetical protein GYMLUDRAFT_46229 [Collybiopsis luxurians FD-317 M1]|uniref:Non-specific serine/threonine protein kinase n=1 Tax=Collybiopsis luxurians FD-317 M1 TaxID=944289 RepID=A0A0D0BQF7_9AGAR|nr:hypothetical protein GYMLUDRAFT_46229 [Collybiopsis luxurians FD-317 M1]
MILLSVIHHSQSSIPSLIHVLSNGEAVISFTYVRRVDPTRLVFEVKTQDNVIYYVKFARRYGEAAHCKAYELGLAPKLLTCEELEGDWKVIVMEPIPKRYKAADDVLSGRTKRSLSDEAIQNVRSIIQEALNPFFQEGFVHGDLRSANIYVDVDKEKGMMVDFDWAGHDGKVKYPPNVRCSSTIWCPETELSFRPIELEHDRAMVKHL